MFFANCFLSWEFFTHGAMFELWPKVGLQWKCLAISFLPSLSHLAFLSARGTEKERKYFWNARHPPIRRESLLSTYTGFPCKKGKKICARFFRLSQKAKFAKVPHISPSPGGLQFLQFAKFRAEKNLFSTFFFQKGILKKRRRERRGCPPFSYLWPLASPFMGPGERKKSYSQICYS